MPSRYKPALLDRLITSISRIRDDAVALEKHMAAEIDEVHPDQRRSARNLVHYIALRRHDIRELQRELSALGLSSLGRTEGQVLFGLDAVLAALHRLDDRPMDRSPEQEPPVDLDAGAKLLHDHTIELLGPVPSSRPVRIMVTMPTDAAGDPELVRNLIDAGMGVCRINCAHDNADVWEAIVRNVRQASQELERPCKVLMDLAGPKLRTGPIECLIPVSSCKPRRDKRGIVIKAGRVWLNGHREAHAPKGCPVWTVDRGLLAAAEFGDILEVSDCRGRLRRLRIMSAGPEGCWAETAKSVYVQQGSAVRLKRGFRPIRDGRIRELPPNDESITLQAGDYILVTDGARPGRPAAVDRAGRVITPAEIPCSLPEILPEVREGHHVFFDDGKIAGVVRRASTAQLEVEIIQAPSGGAKLRSDKGINLPDTELTLPSLTAKDLHDLDFATRHADLIGLSFVRSVQDVARLREELARRDGERLGVLFKIETKLAFERLPRLLLAGMQSPPIGVMVARGDLGVEIGFERLAEVQEEILWLCEAAHVPVIWATQVLETMAKTGMPSRAEVTDAAMSIQAECVMLNKGPYIVEAARFLRNILRRMKDHRQKKRSLLRRLSISAME